MGAGAGVVMLVVGVVSGVVVGVVVCESCFGVVAVDTLVGGLGMFARSGLVARSGLSSSKNLVVVAKCLL